MELDITTVGLVAMLRDLLRARVARSATLETRVVTRTVDRFPPVGQYGRVLVIEPPRLNLNRREDGYPMRFVMKVSIPVEKFNAAVRDGSAGKKLQQILDDTKPEAV